MRNFDWPLWVGCSVEIQFGSCDYIFMPNQAQFCAGLGDPTQIMDSFLSQSEWRFVQCGVIYRYGISLSDIQRCNNTMYAWRTMLIMIERRTPRRCSHFQPHQPRLTLTKRKAQIIIGFKLNCLSSNCRIYFVTDCLEYTKLKTLAIWCRSR